MAIKVNGANAYIVRLQDPDRSVVQHEYVVIAYGFTEAADMAIAYECSRTGGDVWEGQTRSVELFAGEGVRALIVSA